jgi:hypothetical protein
VNLQAVRKPSLRRGAVALLALVLPACRTGLLDVGDDASAMAACTTHALKEVPMQAMALLGPAAQPNLGQTTRIQVTLSLRPCDVLADITGGGMIGDATDRLHLTSRAWISSADCGAARPVTRVVNLADYGELGNEYLIIDDRAPGGTLQLEIDYQHLADAESCTSGLARCQRDCECRDDELVFVCVANAPDGTGICAHACSEDVDCGGAGRCVSDRAPFVCGGGADTNCTDAACPFGQQCDPSHNHCTVVMRPIDGACRCDADCGAGRLCADGHCVIPCTTRADCPVGNLICDGACSPPFERH